ncbi:hypothetical protein [Streptomyces sp. NPDC021212]|uniref:hypothetical protein n=1 Tax=Streptomyces sp. NPDC021212 TaxID=3365118 RepID=UPI0037AE3400
MGIYRQESTSATCLRVDPGSHLRPHLEPVRPTEALMEAGDLVVFDVRITHAGARAPYPDSPELNALRERISAFVTFGRSSDRTRKFAAANPRWGDAVSTSRKLPTSGGREPVAQAPGRAWAAWAAGALT